ncbi:MAG TPA: class I SAM-dependent methyltransferase [Thermomicrobiales bacterium]|nr:class I SAM-dependent methyltransferase [Thermomicrobiales bacterium]
MAATTHDRGDVIWQDASVVANYQVSSKTIPFVDVHFEIMHRLIDAAGIEARNVLDLGAGNGIVTFEVAKRQPVERATLTEFSEPMLDLARQRIAAEQPAFAPTFIVGDFRERDWQDEVAKHGPYDLVVSRFAIHHIPDEQKRAVYGDILGFLRPGGLFVHIEHVASGSPMYNDAHDRLMVECLHGAASGTEGFEDVFASYRMRADGPANILAPVDSQLQWLRDLGFVDVDCAFKAFELSVFAGRRPLDT